MTAIFEALFVLASSLGMLAVVGPSYVLVGGFVSLLSCVLMFRGAHPPRGFGEAMTTIALALGLGVFWPSLPLVILIGGARRATPGSPSASERPRDS